MYLSQFAFRKICCCILWDMTYACSVYIYIHVHVCLDVNVLLHGILFITVEDILLKILLSQTIYLVKGSLHFSVAFYRDTTNTANNKHSAVMHRVTCLSIDLVVYSKDLNHHNRY